MRKTLSAGAVLILLCLSPGYAPAQSDALNEAYKQGLALYQAGRYREATPIFEKTLELGQREFGPEHPRTAILINNLALLYDGQGRHAEAEPLHKRALAIREKALGSQHPNVAQSLENYAALLRKTDRNAEADRLEARAKAIRAKHARENPAK